MLSSIFKILKRVINNEIFFFLKFWYFGQGIVWFTAECSAVSVANNLAGQTNEKKPKLIITKMVISVVIYQKVKMNQENHLKK